MGLLQELVGGGGGGAVTRTSPLQDYGTVSVTGTSGGGGGVVLLQGLALFRIIGQ